jgi:hypothetical protein
VVQNSAGRRQHRSDLVKLRWKRKYRGVRKQVALMQAIGGAELSVWKGAGGATIEEVGKRRNFIQNCRRRCATNTNLAFRHMQICMALLAFTFPGRADAHNHASLGTVFV